MFRLVLDIDANLDPAHIVDDSPRFLPGTDIDGDRRPSEVVCGEDGQVARVIALFVDTADPTRVVAAPPDAMVTFSLEKTTAFPGCASNFGNDQRPDFALFRSGMADASAIVVPFGPGELAEVFLRVRDYGGSTHVCARTTDGQEAALQLPIDANGNGLPDIGWRVDGTWVAREIPTDRPAMSIATCAPALPGR